MAQTEAQIQQAITGYMAAHGGRPQAWYVGIASDPAARLAQHGVGRNAPSIAREAFDSAAARRVERHFLLTVGTDGGTGGGDASTVWVYAYRKSFGTDP